VSEDVLGRGHELLRAAKGERSARLLDDSTVAYLGLNWVKRHDNVRPFIGAAQSLRMIARTGVSPIVPDRIMDSGKKDARHGRLSEVQCTDGSRIHCGSQPRRISHREQLGGRRAEKSVLEQHERP
jgi:hypothetical protein